VHPDGVFISRSAADSEVNFDFVHVFPEGGSNCVAPVDFVVVNAKK
jgi:hypothetical protein